MEFKTYARKPEIVQAAIADGDGNAKSVTGFVPFKKGDALIQHVHPDTVNVSGVAKDVEVTYTEVMSKKEFDAQYELAPDAPIEPVDPAAPVPTGEIVSDPTAKDAALVPVVAVPEPEEEPVAKQTKAEKAAEAKADAKEAKAEAKKKDK